MLKKILDTWPSIMIAVIFSGLVGVIEAYMFVQMMGLLDLALMHEMEVFSVQAIQTLGLAVILVPLGIINTLLKNRYRQKANEAMKVYYIRRVFAKDLRAFNEENTSHYLSGLTNDMNTLETKLVDALYNVVDAAVILICGIWMISTVNPHLVWVGIMVLVVNLGINVITSRPVDRHTQERSDLFDAYTNYIKEVLSAFHLIKNNNLYDTMHEQVYQKSEKVQHKGFVIGRLFTYITALQDTFSWVCIMSVVLLAGYMMLTGKGTIGGVLLIHEAIFRIIGPSFVMSEALPQLFTVKKLIQKIETRLNQKEEGVEHLEIEGIQTEITLEHVGFAYEDGTILEDINITFKKGGKYLVIGPSGGGKSTLLKLLRKYFNPTEGVIKVNKQPLSAIKKEAYFTHIANVEQKVFIFEDTLRNNLTLYRDYSEEEIQEAVTKAGLTDFVQREGLAYKLVDDGKNISGGEKSRLAIARGLLQKADMILLDEAFAALDPEKAKQIEQGLLALEGVTVIHVSHVLFEEHLQKYDGVFIVKDKKVEVYT